MEWDLDSFDDFSAWTRPNKTVVKQYLRADKLEKSMANAKTMIEKDLFL